MSDSRQSAIPTNSPVFVVGCPRSGTTLVYSILLSSGEFPVYEAESRILECTSRYRTLVGDAEYRVFLDDFCNSRQFKRSGLTREDLEQAPVAARASFSSFLAFFMGSIAGHQGKTRWVEKTPNHLLYIKSLGSEFPDARFVHVIRDGRDVALSQRRLRMDRAPSEDQVVRLVWAGKIWETLVSEGQRQGKYLGDRYLEIRYEDVVRDSDRTLARLGEFTGLDLSVSKATQSTVAALGRGNTAYGESMKGIASIGVDRWRSELDSEELWVLQQTIGPKLEQLGYPAATRVESQKSLSPRYRVHALLAPMAIRGKRWLNHNTPLGRSARRPLEIGLE